jgi:hypothetical protein
LFQPCKASSNSPNILAYATHAIKYQIEMSG